MSFDIEDGSRENPTGDEGYTEIQQDSKTLLNSLLSVEDEVIQTVEMPRFKAFFKVRGISSEVYSRLENRCKYPVKDKRRGTITEKVDQDKLSYLLVNEACIDPQWNDPQLLSKYNTTDPVVVIRKRLLLGEVTALTSAIMDASGFTDEIVEIKN
jgi:hypothetical protein